MHAHIHQIIVGAFIHLYGVGDGGGVEDDRLENLCCSLVGLLFAGFGCDSLPPATYLGNAEACQCQIVQDNITTNAIRSPSLFTRFSGSFIHFCYNPIDCSLDLRGVMGPASPVMDAVSSMPRASLCFREASR